MTHAANHMDAGSRSGHWVLRIPLEAIVRLSLFLLISVSGMVMVEPAPYDLMVLGLVGLYAFAGLELRRSHTPLLLLLGMWITGGILTITVSGDLGVATRYIAISTFLVLSAFLYAALLTKELNRMKTLERAYIFAGLLSACAGIVGYLDLFPNAYELFTRYGRAKAAFKDPNVYGPFLLLPALFLTYDILTKPLKTSLFRLALLMVLVLGIFLSFSRAAWGMLVLSGGMVFLLVFINEPRKGRRTRMLGLLGLVFIAAVVLFAIALSIDEIANMFFERAKLVHSYDSARVGRFARHILGFEMVTERPLGLGIGAFTDYFPEEEHNVYLKGFTTYGWLGGFAYVTLIGITLWKATALIFQPRPYQKYVVCFYAAFLVHVLVGLIIDTNHWRHFFLLLGGMWSLIATEAALKAAWRFPLGSHGGKSSVLIKSSEAGN
ncbi:O-antigen ligase family protein [Pseudovibrio sp. SPO723]|uniref:O-antigen ligase family protein n=1 Tax=Nesiotobacter zosterae TaxID=392721 RepID=UPI0029C118DC|nr:O-antigen ligase family protein [Pseudovibrio sp. SPO723]MDX5592605.1 O-antigen ligase family protein [Pseudovibrio sp. SPO723]